MADALLRAQGWDRRSHCWLLKTGSSRISFPQRERFKQRFISGQSVRQILARGEQGSLDRIVKSADVTDYVSNMRAKFIGLGEDAILAVWRAVQEAPDARLAYEILKDIGVVPNRCERNLAEIQQSVR